MFNLRVFGGLSLVGTDGPVGASASQRHRLALLALLAVSLPGGASRDKLIAYLWPERDSEHARNLLKQAVHSLRRALGANAILTTGDVLRLNLESVATDLADFEAALARGDEIHAVSLYSGPFLDGFFLKDATTFERWVDRERDRLAGAYAGALETLAESAASGGDHQRAAEWWKARAAHDPCDSRVALRLMQALEASGNRAGAILHAAVHQQLLRDEFGMETPAEVLAFAERLRRQPPVATTVISEAIVARPSARDPAMSDDRPASPHVSSPSPSLHTRKPARTALRRPAATAAAGVSLVALLSVGWLLTRSDPNDGAPPAVATADPRVIAVLPFANVSGDSAEDYFSDGLTEELIGVLSRVRSLRVAARTSAFAFKGANRDVRDIGRALNVNTILEGSVQKEGDRVRIRAQLINAEDGLHLWADTYERELSDIFAIQSDLALRIATALEAELSAAERDRIARRPTSSPSAHALYLKGRHVWDRRTDEGFVQAIDYFERAIEADPQYAAAYAGLAMAYSLQGLSGALERGEAAERMRDAALKAVALDEGLAEGHAALGAYLHVYEWDADAAEKEQRRALELDPSYATAHHLYGNLEASLGRLERAIEHKSNAVMLDPLAPAFSTSLGNTLLQAGRADDALLQFRGVLELDPTFWRGHAALAAYHEERGDLDEAIAAFERAVELAGANAAPRAGLARVLARAGRTVDARRVLDGLEKDAAGTGPYAPSVATVYIALGDLGAAFAWLERSYREKNPQLRFLRADQGYADVRDDPRFIDLLRRVGLRR